MFDRGTRREEKKMIDISDGVLLCPSCSGNCTHIDTVYAITRVEEDAEPVVVALGNNGTVTHVTDYVSAFGNTGRRHEFRLVGYCETCSEAIQLTFRQHKGQTLVRVGREH